MHEQLSRYHWSLWVLCFLPLFFLAREKFYFAACIFFLFKSTEYKLDQEGIAKCLIIPVSLCLLAQISNKHSTGLISCLPLSDANIHQVLRHSNSSILFQINAHIVRRIVCDQWHRSHGGHCGGKKGFWKKQCESWEMFGLIHLRACYEKTEVSTPTSGLGLVS